MIDFSWDNEFNFSVDFETSRELVKITLVKKKKR